MRTCVIFNPAARGNKARHFRNRLSEIGAACVLKQTTAGGDARRLAAEAVQEGCDTIVAAGGDGTVNEVLNGIGDAPDGFARARLGVLPLGTINVFARELKLPLKLDAAWRVIQAGHETRVDLPRVEYSDANGAPAHRYFAQLAGAGLDARAIELVNWSLKKKVGPLAYVVSGLHALLHPAARITAANSAHTATGELVLVGNGRLYGGPFRIFPQASLRDGVLDVCVFPKANWLALARCAPALLLAGKLPLDFTANFRTENFTLTAAAKTAFELDGEWVGHLPATFSVERLRLRVVVAE